MDGTVNSLEASNSTNSDSCNNNPNNTTLSGEYPSKELCPESHVKCAKICSEREMDDLILFARYGTKVLVRVDENNLDENNSENCSTDLNPLLSGDRADNRTQHASANTPQSHRSNRDQDQNQNQSPNHIQNQIQIQRYKWRSARISQMSPEYVTVRFTTGVELKIPWHRRDVKLFKHVKHPKTNYQIRGKSSSDGNNPGNVPGNYHGKDPNIFYGTRIQTDPDCIGDLRYNCNGNYNCNDYGNNNNNNNKNDNDNNNNNNNNNNNDNKNNNNNNYNYNHYCHHLYRY